ncbi:unnamed protein product [Peronospora destructor]|uniref:Uncharacterized protein n=1 Tax=Peronospora destructor TaxID=86335 RepID=A0AAV0U4Z3_9STRA|nr:unnamed protein product [Peronospora destructor]
MAALPQLLVFCDYLENRLHTSSVSLLRRILLDFYAGNEHTLLDFMRLGASVVSVMPIERTNPRHRKEATRLLTQQKKGDNNVHSKYETSNQVDIHRPTPRDTRESQQLEACVFRFLSARVATKNILWLRDMFYEFCKCEDAMLREFVMRGNEPICVIPVDIQALGMAPLPPSPLTLDTISKMKTDTSTSTSSPVTTPLRTLSPQRKRRREKKRQQQGTSEEMESTGNAPDSHKRKQSRRT